MARDPTDQHKAQFGPFFIDVHERVLTRDGESVTLTPKAFDLLAALVAQPGRLVTKEDLLQTVWPDTFVEESNLSYNVFALRKALGDTSEPKQFIETVPKRGYRFTAALLPVNGNGGNGASQPADALTAATLVGEHSLAAASPALRWPWMRVVAGTALAIVLMGLAFFAVQWRRGPSVPALSAQPVTSVAGVVRSPSLSPDGNYVAFTWTGEGKNNPDIYVQQLGAGSPLRLTTDPANDHGPSWSPDGRTIAFLRRDGSRRAIEVWLMAPLGGGERKLAEIAPRLPAFRPLSLGWCPDSQCLVVADSLPDTEGDGVVLIETAGGAKRPLTFPRPLAADLDPAISPDGRTLIFRRDTTPFSGAFFRLSLDAGYVPHGDAVAITRTLSASKASWTPDGRDILFGSRGALWRLDVFNGGEPTRLPFVGQDGYSPVVVKSANQRQRLVYVRSFADANIYRVDVVDPRADASAPVVRAIASTRGDSIPSLSPDGHRIAFLTDRSGESHIWTADVDGQKAMPLTSIAFTSSPGFPRWSPDGRHIAFHGDPNAKPEVLTAPVSGGEPRSLTSVLPNGGYPTYSRDGKWIYFCIVNAGQRAIWKVPASGGEAVKVVDNGTLAIESMDGRDLYYVETTDRPSPVWRLSLTGGAPVKVLDRVVFGNFDVVTDGIFFMEQTTDDTGSYPTSQPAVTTNLRYFDFATQRSVVVSLNLGPVTFGLTASADGKTVLFSRVDAAVDELMVVEAFR